MILNQEELTNSLPKVPSDFVTLKHFMKLKALKTSNGERKEQKKGDEKMEVETVSQQDPSYSLLGELAQQPD